MGQFRLRGDGLNWREVDGEVVALDLERSSYLASNHAGGVLWHALATGTTRATLVELLVSNFALSEARAEADVDTFLRELADLGLSSSDMAARRLSPSRARAALWALWSLWTIRRQIRARRLDEIRLRPPPPLPSGALGGVRLVLRVTRCTCLERALILQSWLAARGQVQQVVIGVTGTNDFAAHAWLDGGPQCHDDSFHEIARLPAP